MRYKIYINYVIAEECRKWSDDKCLFMNLARMGNNRLEGTEKAKAFLEFFGIINEPSDEDIFYFDSVENYNKFVLTFC